MDRHSLLENVAEELMDAINVLQLLAGGLSENQDDPYIIRSVGVAIKIIKSALSHLQQTGGE